MSIRTVHRPFYHRACVERRAVALWRSHFRQGQSVRRAALLGATGKLAGRPIAWMRRSTEARMGNSLLELGRAPAHREASVLFELKELYVAPRPWWDRTAARNREL